MMGPIKLSKGAMLTSVMFDMFSPGGPSLFLCALVMFLNRVFGKSDLTDFYDFWRP